MLYIYICNIYTYIYIYIYKYTHIIIECRKFSAANFHGNTWHTMHGTPGNVRALRQTCGSVYGICGPFVKHTNRQHIISWILNRVTEHICPFVKHHCNTTTHVWVFITGGCSGRGVQWMGVVLYNILAYNIIHQDHYTPLPLHPPLRNAEPCSNSSNHSNSTSK